MQTAEEVGLNNTADLIDDLASSIGKKSREEAGGNRNCGMRQGATEPLCDTTAFQKVGQFIPWINHRGASRAELHIPSLSRVQS